MGGSGAVTEVRAAQYVRMSTERQQYSTHNQSDNIRECAKKRGIEIVGTYADDGKSGLSIGGRASLQRLIADVEAGAADFNATCLNFSRKAMRRIMFKSPTCITPLLRIALRKGHMAQFSVEIIR